LNTPPIISHSDPKGSMGYNKNMDSSSRIIDRRELLEDYTRNLKHQGVAIFTEEGVRICVDNYESSNSL